MKKLLLATTALAGASLFASGASAQGFEEAANDTQDGASPVVQNQPAFAVRISGTVRVSANFIDQDRKEMGQSFDLMDDFRALAINGSATADNGLSYGFVYDVDEDRAELHLSNRFGRLTFGDTDTATDTLDVTGSSVMVGRGGYSNGGGKNLHFGVGGGRMVDFRSAGGTIRYSTPNYGGLTVAISYTNESDNNADMTSTGDGNSGFEDILSIAGQYTSSYGNYTTVVYVGYEKANRAAKGLSNAANDHQDATAFSVGAKVTGMGAGFAFGYGEVEQDTAAGSAGLDLAWYDVALSFSSGPWSVSAGGQYTKKDDSVNIGGSALNRDQEQTAYSLTTNYALAPGLSIGAGVTHFDIEDSGDSQVDNSATTFTIATTMGF